jgi:hypothetical protein
MFRCWISLRVAIEQVPFLWHYFVQEIFIVAEKQKNDLNEEQIVAFLQDIVGKIRTEEDPLELNTYRRLFRKAVPFTLRAYFAAYLLKQISDGKNPRLQSVSSRGERSSKSNRRDRNDRSDRGDRLERNDRPERGDRGERNDRSERGARSESRMREGRESRQDESKRTRNTEARQSETAKPEPRPVLADDVSTTLFISIGRNRRVYPRDLIGLILQNVEMDREHIGDIRVLDNYSFVQVITEDAEKIIAALNEFDYRGRKLAVSYSRKKDDASVSDDSAVEDSSDSSDSVLSESSSVPESDSLVDGSDLADSDSDGSGDSGSEADESDLENRKENGADI